MRKLDTVPTVTVAPAWRKGLPVTAVQIEIAGVPVARGRLSGSLTGERALAEFRQNPGRFTLLEGAFLARGLGVIPAVAA